MNKLIGSVNKIKSSLGDGVKKVYNSEIPIKEKLRNKNTIDRVKKYVFF